MLSEFHLSPYISEGALVCAGILVFNQVDFRSYVSFFIYNIITMVSNCVDMCVDFSEHIVHAWWYPFSIVLKEPHADRQPNRLFSRSSRRRLLFMLLGWTFSGRWCTMSQYDPNRKPHELFCQNCSGSHGHQAGDAFARESFAHSPSIAK